MPIGPAYPAALIIDDSAAPVSVSQSAADDGLTTDAARAPSLDTHLRIAQAVDANPETGVTGADLTYMIHNSGVTGRSKGVMV